MLTLPVPKYVQDGGAGVYGCTGEFLMSIENGFQAYHQERLANEVELSYTHMVEREMRFYANNQPAEVYENVE